MFELGRTRKARLFADRTLELRIRDGAEYCEIVTCQCDRPWEHCDAGPDTRDWEDYPQPVRVHCDQCEMLSINGVACHETGCPNMHSRYDAESNRWIRQVKCDQCGCDCDYDQPNCCMSNDGD